MQLCAVSQDRLVTFWVLKFQSHWLVHGLVKIMKTMSGVEIINI